MEEDILLRIEDYSCFLLKVCKDIACLGVCSNNVSVCVCVCVRVSKSNYACMWDGWRREIPSSR